MMGGYSGINLAHDKKNKIQAIYNRRPSVLKVTRPGRKWVGCNKKSGRKGTGGVGGSPGMVIQQKKEYPYRRCEVRTWSCIRVGGIVCETAGAVRRWWN